MNQILKYFSPYKTRFAVIPVIIMFVVAHIFALTGCSSQPAGPTTTTSNPTTPNPNEGPATTMEPLTTDTANGLSGGSGSGTTNTTVAANTTSTIKSNPEEWKLETPLDLKKGTVVKVVDGDTIHVRMENGVKESVRLIGVDTPETVHPSKPDEFYGKEASNFTKSQLNGKTVYLEFDVQERDRYQRMLAYVWLSPPTAVTDAQIRERMFNARLLLDGYGQILTIAPDVKYAENFRDYQAEARDNDRGLWAR